MSLTKEERETIILFNEKDGDTVITTYNTALSRRLDSLSHERAEVKFVGNIVDGGVEYSFPKSWVRINPSRQMSDEQRKAAAERFAAIRATK